MIRNVIFDWSGTLVDDLPAVLDATNYVMEQAGLPAFSLDQFRSQFRLPFQSFYERHTPQIPMEQLEAWFHQRFAQVRDTVQELPHARAFLEFCHRSGMRMFVLSTVQPDHFHRQAERIGFAPFLERLYLGVWDKRAKIHELIQDNQLDPSQTLFIGDMVHDVETARHGGVRSCAVLTGYTRLDDLRHSRPDLLVEHLGELQRVLEQHGLELADASGPQSELLSAYPIATVGALIEDQEGHWLMLRTHKWSDLWGIPGGKIKVGETSQTALLREVAEETGLMIDNVRLVLVQDCIHSPEFYRPAHFLLLNYTGQTHGSRPPVRLNGEAEEYRWLRPAEAMQLPLNRPTQVLLETVLRAADAPPPHSVTHSESSSHPYPHGHHHHPRP